MSIYENFKAQILELNLIPEDDVIILNYSDLVQSSSWCIPSREGLYTSDDYLEPVTYSDAICRAFGIPSKYLQDSPPTPVEEDSVFAPREVEVMCGNSS